MTVDDGDTRGDINVGGGASWGNTFMYSGMLALILALALYIFRQRWLPVWSTVATKFSQTTGRYSFLQDREQGFSSDTFNLGTNIESGDSRQGLDGNAKRDIKEIMTTQNVSFDEARAIYAKRRMQLFDIGPDGRPNDPKAIFFS